MIPLDELHTKEFLHNNSLALLQSEARDLVKYGTTGQDLQKELESINQSLPEPLDAADVQAIYEEHDPGSINKARVEKAIVSKDVNELKKCIHYIAALKRRSRLEYGIIEGMVKDSFGKSINLHLLRSEVSAEVRRQEIEEKSNQPDIADVAANWTRQYQDTWAYDEDGQCWRMFNGDYWQEQTSKSSFLDQHGVAALQEAGIAVNSINALNLFQRIAATYCKRQFTPHANKINFADITLDWTTMQPLPHDQTDSFTYCLPYVYDPHSGHPNITAYLKETIPDTHGRQAYMAQVGLALIQDMFMHNFLLLKGPTRSGKTTLLALANAVCGASRVDAWDFPGPTLFNRDVEGKRSRSQWNRERVVCVDELPAEALKDEELFKTMTAHGGAESRAIRKDEDKNNRWRPKLIMSTNNTPHYKDTSGAIKQRAIIIECPNALPEEAQNKTLFPNVLYPEIAAFAVTCIKYGKAVLSRGYFPKSARMRILLDSIANEGNPLKAFLEEMVLLDKDVTPQPSEPSKIITKVLWDKYKAYCEDNGYKYPLAKNSFSGALHDMNIGIKQSNGPVWSYDASGTRVKGRCLLGLSLKVDDGSDPDNNEQKEKGKCRDDALLFLEMSTQCLQTTSETVDTINQPIERTDKEMSTMSTMFQEKCSIGNTRVEGETHTHPSIRVTDTQKNVDIVDMLVGTPVERSNGVNGHKKTLLTTVDILKPSESFKERPCARCGSHEARQREDGQWLCVCYWTWESHSETKVHQGMLPDINGQKFQK